MKAYSQDVRERVLRAADYGYSRSEVVHIFGISLSTLKRYAKQRREKGHMQPKAIYRPSMSIFCENENPLIYFQRNPDHSTVRLVERESIPK